MIFKYFINLIICIIYASASTYLLNQDTDFLSSFERDCIVITSVFSYILCGVYSFLFFMRISVTQKD
jgi:hypothetical protein